MKENNERPASGKLHRLVIGLLLLLCLWGYFILCPPNVSRHVAKYHLILHRLKLIDAAKAEWAIAHPGAKNLELKQQDLVPYLSSNFWEKSIAGERYLINVLSEPPEAQMTKQVDWIPASMKLRWGPDGKDIQVRPNTSQ